MKDKYSKSTFSTWPWHDIDFILYVHLCDWTVLEFCHQRVHVQMGGITGIWVKTYRHQSFCALITSMAPAACFSIIQLFFLVLLSWQSQITLFSNLCHPTSLSLERLTLGQTTTGFWWDHLINDTKRSKCYIFLVCADIVIVWLLMWLGYFFFSQMRN